MRNTDSNRGGNLVRNLERIGCVNLPQTCFIQFIDILITLKYKTGSNPRKTPEINHRC